ncbi:MAG TPA: DUF1573 domain-containing protein [Blastocatellia bacterium]|nr:DUF1573 domain-containing protein [Blastocatellia bacterium]
MKLVRSFSLLMLVLACAFAVSAQQKQPGKSADPPAADTGGPQPEFAIESATHDFGELKSGSPLRYAFKIKNTGKADLIIESVSPG